MKRQKRTVGSIVEIKLANDYYAYGQILQEDVAFFDYYSKERLTDFTTLLNKKIIFIVGVYDRVINKGIWLKVANLPIREDLLIIPLQFIQDALNPNLFSTYNPNNGETKASTRESCQGLECCAVWEAKHVEDRIIDHFEGRKNVWVELLKIK